MSFSVLATLYRAAMCVCFGAHMYTFLFCIYLRMVLPGGQVCICLALVDIVNNYPRRLYIHPYQQFRGVSVAPHPYQYSVLLVSLTLASLLRVYVFVVLIYIS